MDQMVDSLKQSIGGKVVLPEDESYEQLRQVMFNHTAKPRIIVSCKSAEDVAAAVNFARENDLELSVRSGGHSGAGLSTNDGGMVIDLSLLNQVEIVDPEKGIVRIGAGAKWGEAAEALRPYKLAISSGDTRSVGVGGLALSGGIGWMVRTVGLSVDRMESAQLVLADGSVVHASADENVDLFWAIRGGGGNFGIATAFEFRAVPCEDIVGGKLVFDVSDMATVLTGWADYMRTAPEKLNSIALLIPGFGPDAKPQVVVNVCYADSDEVAARDALQPLRELAPVVHEDIKLMPYAEMLEDARSISGLKIRVRNGFVRKVTPELVTEFAANFGKVGAPIVQIRSLGGAMSRVSSEAMAFENREVEALVIMNVISPASVSDDEAEHSADKLWEPVRPFTEGSYIGFQTDNSERSVDASYRTNRKRLEALKAQYDPKNLFRQNANIKAAG